MTFKLVGITDEAAAGGYGTNALGMMRGQALATGYVTEIQFRVVASVAGNVVVGMYADSSAAPTGSALGYKATAVSSGVTRVITVTLDTPISVTKDTYYWVAFNADAAIIGYSHNAGTRKYKANTYTGSLPDAGSGYTSDSYIFVISAWGNATFSQTPTDAVVLVATVAKKDSKSFNSPVTLASSLLKKISKAAFSDAFSFNEAVTALRAYYLALTEAITIVDSLARKVSRAVSDSLSFTETALKNFAKGIIEGVTILDSRVNRYLLTYMDSVTAADYLVKKLSRTVSSSLSFTESIAKNVAKGISNVVTVLDSKLNRYWLIAVDVVTLSDNLTKSTAKIATGITSLTDSLSKKTSKAMGETITIADTITRSIRKALSEAVTLAEGLAKSVTKALTETIEVLDTRFFVFRMRLTEELNPTDAISKVASKIESQVLTLDDSLARLASKSLSASLTFTETVQKSVQKTVSQTLTLVARALREWTHFGSSYMANLLKDTFYLEVNTPEADSTGGHTDNWDFSRTFRGRLSRLPIKERLGNDKVTVYATHKLYCEYITVTTADRVRLGTRYFDIITVENPRNWNKHLELLLLEVE